MARTETFEAIKAAPATATPPTGHPDRDRRALRRPQPGHLRSGVPKYAKLEVLSFDDVARTVTFQSPHRRQLRVQGPRARPSQKLSVIDVKRLRQDPAGSRASLMRRGDPSLAATLDAMLDLDRQRRDLLVRVEALKAERNAATEEVARRKRAKEPADDLMDRLKASGEEVKLLDAQLREIEAALDERALAVPNFPVDEMPDGDASANRVVRSWGSRPRFDFSPKPHWELGAALGLFDLPAGAKITGSGFPLFRGLGARLVRALANFMLDLHTREHGYLEVAPPYLVNRATLTGTGQLPKFVEEVYAAPADDLFLIPTAEVPVTNIHRDEILEAAALPVGYVAYTPCFRREAGPTARTPAG